MALFRQRTGRNASERTSEAISWNYKFAADSIAVDWPVQTRAWSLLVLGRI